MNSPTIPSIPLNPPPLPDTVTPNTTSSCPLYRLITTPHAPSTTVFIVTCHFFAASSNPRLVSSLILRFFSSYSPSSLLPPLRSIPTSVAPLIPPARPSLVRPASASVPPPPLLSDLLPLNPPSVPPGLPVPLPPPRRTLQASAHSHVDARRPVAAS